jgi:hypothetical protein
VAAACQPVPAVRHPDQKKNQIEPVKYLESASCAFRLCRDLAKILKTSNLPAKYSIPRTYADSPGLKCRGISGPNGKILHLPQLAHCYSDVKDRMRREIGLQGGGAKSRRFLVLFNTGRL